MQQELGYSRLNFRLVSIRRLTLLAMIDDERSSRCGCGLDNWLDQLSLFLWLYRVAGLD